MRKKRLPMNLHFFGYEEGSGSPNGDNGTNESEGTQNTNETESKGQPSENPKTFDELLKEGTNQTEFDRRLKEALNAEKEKWSVFMDDKLSEAEKLAKMTKDEKTEYLRQKHEKELEDREAKIVKRELMAEAKSTLAEKKLPVGLAEVLNYTDADSCNKSIAAVEKAFQEAVQEAVEEKLKGGVPPKKAQSEDSKDLAKQVEDLMMGI